MTHVLGVGQVADGGMVATPATSSRPRRRHGSWTVLSSVPKASLPFIVKTDFYRDLKAYAAQDLLRVFGVSAIAEASTDEVLRKLVALAERRPPARPRKVERSRALGNRLATAPRDLGDGVERVLHAAEVGDSLDPFLPTGAFKDDRYDDLLNEWDVHHFHLGEITADGKAERTDTLLFARVLRDRFLAIDVMDHLSFESVHLLDVLKEWEGQVHALLGVAANPWTPRPSPSEIRMARRSGVTTIVTLSDGTACVPPGISTARVSGRTVAYADRILDCWDGVRRSLEADAHEVGGHFGRHFLRYEIGRTDGAWFVVEQGSGFVREVNAPWPLDESTLRSFSPTT